MDPDGLWGTPLHLPGGERRSCGHVSCCRKRNYDAPRMPWPVRSGWGGAERRCRRTCWMDDLKEKRWEMLRFLWRKFWKCLKWCSSDLSLYLCSITVSWCVWLLPWYVSHPVVCGLLAHTTNETLDSRILLKISLMLLNVSSQETPWSGFH